MESTTRKFIIVSWFVCLIFLSQNLFSQQPGTANSQSNSSQQYVGNSSQGDSHAGTHSGNDKGDKKGDKGNKKGGDDHKGEKGDNHHGDKGGDNHKGDNNHGNDHSNCDHGNNGGNDGNDDGNNGSGHGGECEGNCFSTEVISATLNEEGCISYELLISHGPDCRYELSHLAVEVPCGTIHELSNDRGWKLEYGKDPTTGLTGFKIDDISNYGKGEDTTFVVKVTICGDDQCPGLLGQVAYKAGQCVDYQTLEYTIDDGSDDTGGGDNGGGDTGGGSGGGGTGGGDTGGGTGGGDTGGGTGGGDTGGGSGGGDTGGGSTTCSTLLATLAKTDVNCFNAADGQLSVEVQTGTGPITYQWSNGETSNTLTGLAPGNYTVTVVDADGNTLTLSETIVSPADILITKSTVNPTCSGFATGSIDITVSGGSAPYTYSWNNGATTEDVTNLPAGLLVVTVTDANGCQKKSNTLLQNATSITASAVLTKPSNCAAADGAINITISGNGSSPFSYLWSNGSTAEDLVNIPAGNYSLTITDANGCTGTGNYNLVETNTIQTSFSVMPTSCIDDNSGSIDITVTGGTAPYTYSWSNGPATEDVSGLKAGIYRVTVTDALGCSQVTAINVPKKTIQVQDITTQPLCFGDSTGSITVIPSDGVSPYTYSWTTGGTSNSISNLHEGTYQVTITDASGCSRTLQYAITQPQAITSSTVVTTADCGAEGSYSIDLSVSGGKAPYSYDWSGGQTTQDITGINSGSYAVLITDGNGCTSSQTTDIDANVYQSPCSIIQPVTSVTCNSVGNSITSDALGATSYNWSVASSDGSWMITSGANSASAIFSAGNPGSDATFSLTVVVGGCTKTCTFSTGTGGCTVRDSDGGGDPAAGDPCGSDSTTTADNSGARINSEATMETEVSAYPNPFESDVTFEWTAPETEYVKLEVYDALGSKVDDVYTGKVEEGKKYSFTCHNLGRNKIYIYRLTSRNRAHYGKLLRR